MFMRRSVAAPVLAVAVLAGCSTAARDGMISPQPAVGSRMAARPMAGDLLYLSDVKTDVVYVYSYPQGKLVGTLADFVAPRGECASASGNVWIVDSGTYAVLEYTHGGTSAITALNIEGVPAGCSVDPLTNNVAVTSRGTSVTVTVFRHAHHKWEPFHFRDPQMRPVFCGYDAKGNLFVDGLGKGNVFRLDELVRGGSMLASVAVSQSIKAPGQVQWDGTDLAIGDAGVAPSVVYRFSEGTGGLTETGATTLGGTASVRQSWIAGSTIIGPDYGKDVGFWNYPEGGAASKVLRAVHGYGATLSIAHSSGQ